MSKPIDDKLAALLGEDKNILAARLFAGDSASMYLLLLSDGETVRTSADPYAAALAAIASGTP